MPRLWITVGITRQKSASAFLRAAPKPRLDRNFRIFVSLFGFLDCITPIAKRYRMINDHPIYGKLSINPIYVESKFLQIIREIEREELFARARTKLYRQRNK